MIDRHVAGALAALVLSTLPCGSGLAQDLRFRAVDHAVPFGATVSLDAGGLPGLIGVRDPVSTAAPAPDMRARGLAPLFTTADGIRDVRVVDVDGDGLADIVGNAKSDTAPMSAVLRLFRNLGGDTYREDGDFLALDLRGYGETLVIADFDNDGCPDVYNPVYTFQDRCYDMGRPDGVDCRPGAPTTGAARRSTRSCCSTSRVSGPLHGAFPRGRGSRGRGDEGRQRDRSEGREARRRAGRRLRSRRLARPVGGRPSVHEQGTGTGRRTAIRGCGTGLPPDRQGWRTAAVLPRRSHVLSDRGRRAAPRLERRRAPRPADHALGLRTVPLRVRAGTTRLGRGSSSAPASSAPSPRCKPIFSHGAPEYRPVVFTGNFGIKSQDLDGDGLVDIVAPGGVRPPRYRHARWARWCSATPADGFAADGRAAAVGPEGQPHGIGGVRGLRPRRPRRRRLPGRRGNARVPQPLGASVGRRHDVRRRAGSARRAQPARPHGHVHDALVGPQDRPRRSTAARATSRRTSTR